MKSLLYGKIIPVLLISLAVALSIADIISSSVFLYIIMTAVALSIVGQQIREAGRR